MIDSLSIFKEQYELLQKVVIDVCHILEHIEPNNVNKNLKNLLQLQDMKDLEANANCLLNDNEDLKAQMVVKEGKLLESWKKTNKVVQVA